MLDTAQVVKDIEDQLIYGDKLKLNYELIDGFKLLIETHQTSSLEIGETLEIALSVVNSDDIVITNRFFNYDEQPIEILHDHIEAIKNPHDIKVEEEYLLDD